MIALTSTTHYRYTCGLLTTWVQSSLSLICRLNALDLIM